MRLLFQSHSLPVLRFIAAAMVVGRHSSSGFMVGAAGVDIFFVISGFIITRVAQDKSPDAFIRDRLLRIFPIWYLCVVPWLIIGAFTSSLTLPRIAATLTLWPIYDEFTWPALNVGWTFSFELLFYAGMAIVMAYPRAVWLLRSEERGVGQGCVGTC